MIIKIQTNVPLNQVWKIFTLFPDCLQTYEQKMNTWEGDILCNDVQMMKKKIRQKSIMPLNEMNHPFFISSLSHSKTTTCPLSSVNCLFVSLSSSYSVSGEKDFSVFSHSAKRGLKILVTVKHSLLPADLPLMYDSLTRKRMSSKPIFIKN